MRPPSVWQVSYSADGLLEKNKDSLFADLLELGGASSSPVIAALFPKPPKMSTKPKTAGSQFRTQMNELISLMRLAEPHYIRCIKPNDQQKPGVFVPERARHQARYLGLLENVRVRRAGFAFRQPFARFEARYKMLCPATWPSGSGSAAESTKAILDELAISPDAYKFGRTKVDQSVDQLCVGW